RFEPRNLAFTDGLHRWQLDGTFLRQVTGSHDQDYSCTAEDGRAILAAAVPGPAGFAPVTGTRDWTRHEVTAQVPADAISIIFGVFLNGPGQIELRNPQLDPHPANQ
ncbi:MAG: hypothetical protein ACRDPD_24295, partial [Streptosporangiaceae bacterium]